MTRAEELADFAAIIESRFGHLPDNSRQAELTRTLATRMQALAITDYARYRAHLEGAAEEWIALAPLLTVPETYFFRLPDQLEALAGEVIPALLRQLPRGRGLRILSAGCASGEEPYSIRILLNERFHQLSATRGKPGAVTIDGFDLSLSALERARAGEYSEWSLRATSDERRRANFTRKPLPKGVRQATFTLLPPARTGVSFRQVNLLDEPALSDQQYDVIFCRNVLIYFTDRAVKEAIARLRQRLAPGGYLFLGPAESLRGLSREFTLVQTHDVVYYQLREGASARPRNTVVATGPRPVRTLMPQPAAVPPDPDGGTWYEAIGSMSSRLKSLIPPADLDKPVPEQKPKRPAAPDKPVAQRPALMDLIAAERFADALSELDSGRAGALPFDEPLLRAALLLHLGRFEDAARACTLMLEAGQPQAGAHYLAGLCQDHAGNAREAEQQMMQATYLDPGFALPMLHRGLLAGRRGDLATARTALTRALKAFDQDDPVRLTLFAGALQGAGLRELCRIELERLDRA